MEMNMNRKLFYRTFIAAVCINLVIGINNAWSVFESALVSERAWTHVEASLPSTVYSFFYAVGILSGGIIQDHLGPKKTCRIAAVLAATGFTGSALSRSAPVFTLFYGVFTGLMVSFAYSSALPALLRWLPEKEQGRYSGFTICAFALTASYIAPVCSFMLPALGIRKTFLIIGLFIFLILFSASFFLYTPPAREPGKAASLPEQPVSKVVFTPEFAALFCISFSVTFAFTLLVTHIINIADVQAGAANAFYLITVFSVMNCISRIAGGAASDVIYPPVILFVICLLDLAFMLLFNRFGSIPLLILGSLIVGMSFGTNMSIIPKMVSSFFGMDHFGRNFGLVSISSGIAGVPAAFAAGASIDRTGTYLIAYMITAVILIISLLLLVNLIIRSKRKGQKMSRL